MVLEGFLYKDETKDQPIPLSPVQRRRYLLSIFFWCITVTQVSVMKTLKIFGFLLIFAVGFLLFDTANCSPVDIAEDVSQHKNIGLLKDSCGLPEHDRTLIGNTTRLFEFRWVALISYEVREVKTFSCQGTLISDRYVLTSAHCFTHLPKDIKPLSVRLGEHDLNSDQDCEESVLGEPIRKRCAPAPLNIDIEEIITHPIYGSQRPRSVEHDIALLRLASPVVSDYVNPICLPIGLPQQTMTFDKELNLVGWNKDWYEMPIPVRMQVPVIGYDWCVAALRNLVPTLTERNICVGGRHDENPFCPLSGSSLSYYTEESKGHGRYVMAAVGPVGHGTCTTDVIPEVYTRVGNHMKWILDNMKP